MRLFCRRAARGAVPNLAEQLDDSLHVGSLPGRSPSEGPEIRIDLLLFRAWQLVLHGDNYSQDSMVC